ncbi:transcription-repair coupling factor [Bartonella quintana]|uniref:Transcription-repair-coupling factor n=1 Tax=Bartonella quintana JK 68 TaxID=1134503 RepID=A0ABR4SRL0_BARQI|nr:transcription-repair coupling factor [Bartonella quintana]ETS11531.1 transcription-repair coupling factor [Bartonella quintana BQ2-D70]ETS18026.1 transcription-repair coupling factor [Bartonella quintana JK 7]ETS18855.1 transcription-repair coupling factor [Bartonella quintana JK 12]KEC60672.1 transcription-repair coupling factor [Bartonella quintana JK 31]KEC61665.1 transcription-repair coupling factor [Bartonella quintana JK 63]
MPILKKIVIPKNISAHMIFDGVTDGFEAFALAKLSSEIAQGKPLIYVVRDGTKIAHLQQVLNFIEPNLPVLEFPAWDCLPYDRVSPGIAVTARRLSALAHIANLRQNPRPAIILTTANAIIQKLPPRELIETQMIYARVGQRTSMGRLIQFLESNGFERVTVVRDVGEFAVRGGILDIFSPVDVEPLRLDFFGNTLETIRVFDSETQRTINKKTEFLLHSMSEVVLTPEVISRFKSNYIRTFGVSQKNNMLYEALSQGRRFAGMEHWLPFFYEKLDSFFDHCGNLPLVFEHLIEEVLIEHYRLIEDYYNARKERENDKENSTSYHPIEPNLLYLTPKHVLEIAQQSGQRVDFTPFNVPKTFGQTVIHANVKLGYNFVKERNAQEKNVFSSVVHHIASLRAMGKKVLLACWSEGSLNRLVQVLDEHGLKKIDVAKSLQTVRATPHDCISAAVVMIEHGFETEDFVVIAEQDILGDRFIRSPRRRKHNTNFISEIAALNSGDIVVHIDHGIGQFVGLKTITATGILRDCLEIKYAGGDRLFLPIENIELLSRYGSEGTDVTLDKLGGVAWQARKTRLKKHLLEMAGQLIHIAAERATRSAPAFVPPIGPFDEFVACFPYEETEDQKDAIDAVLEDLASGKPMDRLICGDVGFGKTEVAIRSAFVAALNGYQVAVVVPTTLLSRQHYKTFLSRFQGLPVKIAHASRLVKTKEFTQVKKGVSDGTIDIVVGTHALLSGAVNFLRLGLLIIDEEQHFGVKHKERLKELKSDIHVLTLSATPIPRTLGLALSGVRELSLITTPPIDRMAVRTFIAPFDTLVIRETLLREYYRGGQSFYVCPRISDLAFVEEYLKTHVPELKFVVAHGQMPAGQLDNIMNAFYDGQYDVLLSTTIIESGLDIPTANTLIVHRAEIFGLSALYQLRGRVGRSKQRAYALFTFPSGKVLTAAADRRLKVLQSLNTLGSGFQLASHDMDIRGSGNFLGEEQSGHIKEVGFELYQKMLEEAVAELKDGKQNEDKQWSPQISLGTTVMIPESFVPDLSLRMGLYRRLTELDDLEQIDEFAAELIDRFGPLPLEVQHLLKVFYIKTLCRKAHVEKLDTGPKGIIVQFRNNYFANSVALVQWIGKQGSMAKIRPNQSIIFIRDWTTLDERLAGVVTIMIQLVEMAEQRSV